MVRLAVSVEGLTEERFIEKLLKPYLEEREIYVFPIRLGKTGGDVSLSRVKKDLNSLVLDFDKVTTLYDFYGFKGTDEGENKESLEQKIIDSVSEALRNRVIPYVQMHEFEGLLFSSPRAIEQIIGNRGLATWAQGVLDKFEGNPEKINDSKETVPSKRLSDKVAGYLKTTHGPDIAEEIGLDTLRERCFGFGNWLSRLEGLRE